MDFARICEEIAKLAKEKFGFPGNESLSTSEQLAVKDIFEYAEAFCFNSGFHQEVTLIFDSTETVPVSELEVDVDNELDEFDYPDDEFESQEIFSSQSSQDWEELNVKKSNQSFTIAEMTKILKSFEQGGWKRVQERHKRVKHKNYINNFKKYIERNGTKKEKLDEIEKSVLLKFSDARRRLCPVHDEDLRRWGYEKAKELKFLNSFKSSPKWVWSLKSRNRIVSRKVTRYVTRVQKKNADAIDKSATLFVAKIKNLIAEKNYTPDEVFNSDQSGFKYEHASTRSLDSKGSKDTKLQVKSKNDTTHSYTIMPMISMSGKLPGKLLVCLQEKDGRFGPRVKADLQIPPNIYVTCSSSGLFNRKIMSEWISECLSEAILTKCLLLLDSWDVHKDFSLFECVQDKCQVQAIPPSTTGQIQPCDVYYFRQVKIMRTRITERIALEGLQINLKERNNILKLHSLHHNQMQSPKFLKMIRFAFEKSGYSDENSKPFENMREICFTNLGSDCEHTDSVCERTPFIRCSWCEKTLCLNHFFVSFHTHFENLEEEF